MKKSRPSGAILAKFRWFWFKIAYKNLFFFARRRQKIDSSPLYNDFSFEVWRISEKIWKFSENISETDDFFAEMKKMLCYHLKW